MRSSTPSPSDTRWRWRPFRRPTRACSSPCHAICARCRTLRHGAARQRSRTLAVYTEVPDEELATFVALYDIGPLLAAKGIAEGVENSNYLIHTGAGYFILTLYEKRVKE